MGKNTGTKTNLLVQIALSKTVAAKFQLRRVNVCEIRIKNAKGIQFSDVMSTNLISSHK